MGFVDRVRFWFYRQGERSKFFEKQDRVMAEERKVEYEKEFQEWKQSQAVRK